MKKPFQATDILDVALSRQEIFAKAFFSRPESLAKFLPYDEYLDRFGLFINKDGSLGALYEVTLCEHETKNSTEIADLIQELQRWFQFDERTVLQLVFSQSPESLRELPARTAKPVGHGNEILSEIFDRRINRLHNAYADESPEEFAYKRRLLLCVKRLAQKEGRRHSQVRQVGKSLIDSHSTLSHELSSVLRQIREFQYELTRLELSSPLELRKLDGTDLIQILRFAFSPKSWPDHEFSKWNPGLPISDQVISDVIQIEHSGIRRNNRKSRVITLKNAPAFAYPGAMTYFLALPFPYRISLNVSFPASSQVKRHFAIKEFFLQNTPSAQARRQRAEVEALQDQLVTGDRVLQMTFSVIVEAETDEALDSITHRVLALFRDRLESEAIVEESIGTGLWLSALPFNYHPIADYTSQRAIRLLRSDLAHFCPVFDSFRGLSEKQSLFLSRERNLVGFSLRSTGNSHHTAVIGDTGSAKSGLVISLLLGEMRRDPKPLIFVIDRKTSYGMVGQMLNSEITTFERGKPLPFSPFAGECDEEKIAFLVHLLTTAMKLTSAHFELDSEHKTCLTEAIRRAHANKIREHKVRYEQGELIETSGVAGAATMSLDDIVAQLGALTGTQDFETYGKTIEEITKKLRPFYGDGIYAPFFRSGESVGGADLKDLYVYDLDSLTYDPVLQTLVTMGVVDEIRRKIKNPEASRRGGFIVIEELGLLGRDNPVAKDFVIEVAETFRKLGYFLIGLTPNPKNYFDLAAGQAMWSVADHYLFLMTKPDNVEAIATKSDLLDEAGVQIVKSLRTVPGRYSEVFYIHKTRSAAGVFRNEPSALELWLMPTHAPDHRAAMKALEKFPGNPDQAVRWLAETYPRGTTEEPKQ